MKKYLRTFTSTFLTFCIFIPLLNLIADPFWYYRIVEIQGFNQVKSKFQFFERQYKPLILDKEKPHAIILGSSYSEIGLDPLHPGLAKNGSKTYNFGMINAHWDEVICNFHFAIQSSPINQIVLGIDARELKNYDCSEKIELMKQPHHMRNLMSLEATIQSFKVLGRQGSHEATHTREGLFFYGRGTSNTKEAFKIQFRKNGKCQPPNDKPKPKEKSAGLDLAGLRDVIRNILKKNIFTKIIINPMHTYNYENLIGCKGETNYWDILYQIAEALEQETSQNRNLIELWDFTGYNKLMAQSVSPAEETQYWQDPRHYNFELGNFFLNRMFGVKSSEKQEINNLGVQITTKNIYQHMEKIHQEREKFINDNPWFLSEYKSLTE